MAQEAEGEGMSDEQFEVTPGALLARLTFIENVLHFDKVRIEALEERVEKLAAYLKPRMDEEAEVMTMANVNNAMRQNAMAAGSSRGRTKKHGE
jgi:hypothetical protein